MAEPKVTIQIGADTQPLEKATKQAEKTLDGLAANAKRSGTKIDEAFRTASGKVQEAIGPLGKLLSPEMLGIGAIGLAAKAMYGLAQAGAAAAASVAKLGEASGLSITQINKVVEHGKAFEAAQDRMTGAFARMTSGVVEGFATIASGAAELANDIMDIYDSITVDQSVYAHRAMRGMATGEDVQRANPKFRSFIVKDGGGRRRTVGRSPVAPVPGQSEEELLLTLAADLARQREAERLANRTLEQMEADAAAMRGERQVFVGLGDGIMRTRTRKTQMERESPEMLALSEIGGQTIADIIGGRNVGPSITGAVGAAASLAATSFLGPIAGALIGGVIDGFVGLISDVFSRGESPEERARREAKAAMHKQRMRDAAAARRNALPEFDPFLGVKNRAVIVNVNFNGPVGSPGRVARQLADAMGGA